MRKTNSTNNQTLSSERVNTNTVQSVSFDIKL